MAILLYLNFKISSSKTRKVIYHESLNFYKEISSFFSPLKNYLIVIILLVCLISKPDQSHGLLYNYMANHLLMPRQAQTVKIDCVRQVKGVLNLNENQQ